MLDQACVNQLGCHDLAEAFDIHGAAVSEVLQAAFQLADTVARGAAQEDILFFKRTLANGAGFRGTDRFGLRGALGEVNGDDGGNDFPRFFHTNKVTDADVFASDLFEIMKSGSSHGGTAKENRFELCDGGDDAGSAHLKGHVEEAGFRLLWGVLVSDGPAGSFIGLPQNLLLIEAVDLDDRTIGGEGELGAGLIQLANGPKDFGGGADVTEPFVTG